MKYPVITLNEWVSDEKDLDVLRLQRPVTKFDIDAINAEEFVELMKRCPECCQ